MKLILKELVISIGVMSVFFLMFLLFPVALNSGLFFLTLSAMVLMFATKNTSLNVIGMFLIAGVIFSFLLFHGLS